MQLKEISRQEEWDELAASLGAGPYLFWAWRVAVERAYGHRPLYLAAFRGKTPEAILPLFKFKTPRGSRMVSLPFCDYGGILATNEEAFLFIWEKARELARAHGGLELRFPERPPYLSNEKGSEAKVRLLLPLPDRAETLWKQLKAKVRSQVRRPQKEGAEAVTGGQELLPAFYRIYQENMHYLGSPPHSLAWFKAVLSSYGEMARVVLVHLKGEPLAGGILLLTEEEAANPWASSRRSFKKISPNMLLYWQMLALATERGLLRFDFGRSSPGSGTYRFKRQWGAEEKPLFWYGREEGGPSRGRALAARIWPKIPLSWANFIGPRLRRYISL